MPLTFVRQDITKLEVDAIVNAANTGLRAGGGVCGAIFAAAGYDELTQACRQIGSVETGAAVATPGFALPARHVIHTAGPIWRGGAQGEEELLSSCYRSSLELARSLGDASIAFPLISSGIYGYPVADAFSVAVSSIRAYLADDPDMEVTLCVFDKRATTVTQGLFGAIDQYVTDEWVEENPFARRAFWERAAARDRGAGAPFGSALFEEEVKAAPMAAASMPCEEHGFEEDTRAAQPPIEELLHHLDAPFSQTLLAMIDERGLADSQVYARANLSRQYFSKLRAGSLNPSKRVVLSLAVALELTLDETRLLLERAGHALTHASKADVIVEWFIRAGRYDIFEINQTLFAYDQPLLGSS